MRIKCPHGYMRVAKLGAVTIEDSTVTVFDAVCDSADRCGIVPCKFHDTSREATRRFQRAATEEHTLQGLLHTRAEPDRQLRRHLPSAERSAQPHSQARGTPNKVSTADADELFRKRFDEIRADRTVVYLDKWGRA